MDPSIDDELIEILRNTSMNVEARSQGWTYIIRLSSTSSGLHHILNSEKYIPFIFSYISKENPEELMKLAFKALINISSNEEGSLAILKYRKDVFNSFLRSIAQDNSKFIELKCYILSNMSRNYEFLEQTICFLLSSEELYQKLIAVYNTSDLKIRCQYNFLTLVFANISRQTAGRRLLMQDPNFINNILKSLKPTESEIRRLGTALIIRNCFLETEYHEKFVNDITILTALLLPLMVPQEYESGGEMGELPPELQFQCLHETKERDNSVSVRRVLVEALTVLCYSECGWRFLKSNGTYYVVRDLHKWETDQTTKEAIEQLVSYFLVVDYVKSCTSVSDSYSDKDIDIELIQQLESDMTKDLPDFVI